MTDEELLALLHSNPQKGFEIIINKYTGLMYAIAYNKLSSFCTREDIEECVSDIFVLFYEQKEAIDLSKGSIKSFLMILAKRTSIKRFQKACLSNTKLISIDDESFSPQHLTANEDTTEPLIEKETRQMLIRGVKALKEPDCTIILRKYYLGETAKEIAKSVHMSQNAVQKRITRSLKKLKTILGGF